MIRIDDDYVIDADERCYILMQDAHRESVDKKGKTRHVYKNIGYYSTLYNALIGARNIYARKSVHENDTSLGEACSALVTLNKRFEEMYKEIAND